MGKILKLAIAPSQPNNQPASHPACLPGSQLTNQPDSHNINHSFVNVMSNWSEPERTHAHTTNEPTEQTIDRQTGQPNDRPVTFVLFCFFFGCCKQQSKRSIFSSMSGGMWNPSNMLRLLRCINASSCRILPSRTIAIDRLGNNKNNHCRPNSKKGGNIAATAQKSNFRWKLQKDDCCCRWVASCTSVDLAGYWCECRSCDEVVCSACYNNVVV